MKIKRCVRIIKLQKKLNDYAIKYADITMIARTHHEPETSRVFLLCLKLKLHKKVVYQACFFTFHYPSQVELHKKGGRLVKHQNKPLTARHEGTLEPQLGPRELIPN